MAIDDKGVFELTLDENTTNVGFDELVNTANIDPGLVEFIYDKYSSESAANMLIAVTSLETIGLGYLVDDYMELVEQESSIDRNELPVMLLERVNNDLSATIDKLGVCLFDDVSMHVKNVIIDTITSITASDEYIVFLSGTLEAIDTTDEEKLSTVLSILSSLEITELMTSIESVKPTLIPNVLRVISMARPPEELPVFDYVQLKRDMTRLQSALPMYTILAVGALKDGVNPGLAFSEYFHLLKNGKGESVEARIVDIISLLFMSADGRARPMEVINKYQERLLMNYDDGLRLKNTLMRLLSIVSR